MVTAKRTKPALEAAVQRAIVAAAAGDSWRAELALSIARDIEAAPSLSAKVSAGKLLTETMANLGAGAVDQPEEQKPDRLDELDGRRRKRRASA